MIQKVKTDSISNDQVTLQSPRSEVFSQLQVDSKASYLIRRKGSSQVSPTNSRSQASMARSPRNDIYQMSTDAFTHFLSINPDSQIERVPSKVKASTSVIPNTYQSPSHQAQASHIETNSERERSEEALTSRAHDVFSRDVIVKQILDTS